VKKTNRCRVGTRGGDKVARKSKQSITGDPFLDSLHTLKPSEVAGKRPRARFGRVIGALIRLGALLVCLAVLATSLVSITESLVDYKATDSYYEDLSNLFGDLYDGTSNPFGPVALANKNNPSNQTPEFGAEGGGDVDRLPDEGGNSSVNSELMLQIRAKLGALKAQNSDLMGWITIPDTKIDYPMVHTVDNEYYLNHSFDRNYLRAGTIFADYRNSKDLSRNKNTVIYGHNMMSGAMFSCISDFFSKNYFNENRYIYIYTEAGIYVYKTFSIRKIKVNKDVSYITTYFATDEDYQTFLNKQHKASAVKTDDVVLTPDSKIITLSTCTNAHDDNERYSLQAVLVEIQK
jgi:sortase B